MHILLLENSRPRGSRYSDCLVIFLGLESPDAATIDDAYARWSESNVTPPTTILLGKADLMRQFHHQLASVEGKFANLDRLYRNGGIESVVMCGFDYTGRIHTIGSQALPEDDLTDVFYAAVRVFVERQIETSDVIIPAPPGTYFDKLSTRFSTHFIRAEALLQSTAGIELLALRLLAPFNDWYQKSSVNKSDVATIFLDTMSVWPVAEKLSQLHQACNPKIIHYRIESFKSYDGLTAWDPPRRPAFVIISASTSGGLATRVGKKLGSANAEVWTMLALEPGEESEMGKGRPEKSIFHIPRQLKGRPALDGLRSEFQSEIPLLPPGTETISIVGERFLSQPAKPKRVRMVHKTLDEGTKRTLATIAKKHVVKVARGRFDARSRWSLSFDFPTLISMACDSDKLGQDSLLKSWLKNYSSPSPIAIVYPSADGASAVEVANAAVDLAQRTEDVLKELTPGAELFKISSDELAESSKPGARDLRDCSIIVVAPVIGNGFVFKQISALLRHKQPTGPRLFLALAVLPETLLHLTQLKSDIGSVSSDDQRYEFRYHFAIPIGRIDTAVQWRTELEVLHELEELMAEKSVTAGVIVARSQLLEQFKVLNEQSVFLPSKGGNPLSLSSGFFLWPGSTDIAGDNYGGAVLLSIAALLQGARVAASKADDTSLRTGLFQHALICPETFTRFNDSVIQAALLRAAYPAELNYSVSAEMSHDMERLLLKWLQYYDHPVGAAAGEFLLAIATGKLKLRNEHMANVLNYAKNLEGWIGCLGIVAEKRAFKTI